MAVMSPKSRVSIEKFQSFVAAMQDTCGWQGFIVDGSLNLKLIAETCDISRSSMYSNKHLKKEVSNVAEFLFKQDIIETLPYKDDEKVNRARKAKTNKDNKELVSLRTENQSLKNRVNELIAQLDEKIDALSRFESMEKTLGETGRIPR